MKHFLLITLFVVLASQVCEGTKLSKGFRTYKKGKYDKAIDQFKSEAAENSQCAICYYGLALIYDDPEFKGYNLEKAYKYVHKALDILDHKHPRSVDEEFEELGIKTREARSLAKIIERDILKRALASHDPEDIQGYITKHQDALNKHLAEIKRNELAFKIAQEKHTVESYDLFLTKYPEAEQAGKASILRNNLAFERAKKNNTIDAYDNFIKSYPEAEELGTAIELRNQKAYIALLESQELQHDAELKASRAETRVKDLEIANHRQIQKYYVIIGVVLSLILLLVVAGYLLKRRDNIKINNQKKRIEEQRDEILTQKTLVEEKNNQILDSIKYARLIQNAILPTEEKIRKNFADAFVLYKPKDLVSGDFYWFGERDGKKIIAAVDCTGHGVPGAFMSMIGNTLLNTIVEIKGITSPDEILNELRKEVIHSLDAGDTQTQDGMDIALCVLDPNHQTVAFAGAFNPLILVNDTLEVIKADRMPIGRYHGKEENPFTCKLTPVKKGDVLYIFTDGFQDQFGGEEKKKFSPKKFRTLLEEIHDLPMIDQEKRLSQELNRWRGKIEQVDDVLVMGVRI